MRISVDRRHVLTSVAALLLIGVIALLPDVRGDATGGNETVQAFRGRIEAIDLRPGGEGGGNAPRIPIAQVRALEGLRVGQLLEAYLSGSAGSQTTAAYAVGEEVVVTITQGAAGSAPYVAVSDRWRVPGLQGLGLVFAAAVVLVGGWHGLRALLALGLTVAVILKFLLPLLVLGAPPVPLAVIGASGVTVATVILTEGWKRSSLAAILGTTGSLALIGLVAAAVTGILGFTYTAGSDLPFLVTASGGGLDLRGVLLAAFILGAVGVLDDVTVTQAVLVDELAKGGLRGPALMASAMRIGRSHIAATINTLFLAYVGGGLPLLVLLVVSRQPGALVFNNEVIATEIVRTVAGSIGIVASVPVTTVIAAALATEAEPGAASGRLTRRSSLIAATAVFVGGLLVAVAVLPLTSGERPALAPDTFEPVGQQSAPPSRPAATSASPDGSSEPLLVGRNEPAPIALDGQAVGTVTVMSWTLTPPAEAGGSTVISVLVRYEATAPFDLERGEWNVLMLGGALFPLVPDGGVDQLSRVLQPGEALQLSLSGQFVAAEEPPFIAFVDAPTSAFLLAVRLE